MIAHRLVAALATLFALAACSENPLAPDANANFSPNSPSFSRGSSSYTFTELAVRDATGNVISQNTLPFGINAGGEIVGAYTTGSGCLTTPPCTKGFKLIDGVYTTVVYHDPITGVDAPFTQVRGVSPDGDVVGTYRMAGEPANNLHGFLLTTSGAFSRVEHPDHLNTVAQRILPDGTILGCYHEGNQTDTMHGMMTSRAGITSLEDNPGSMENGGTPSGGRLTGIAMDKNGIHGFLRESGILTPFDDPYGIGTTQAWDMSPNGTIVGFYVQGVGTAARTHGFTLDRARVVGAAVDGTYTTIDYPGSNFTDIFGTNASGAIVGRFRVAGSSAAHGYIATRNAE